MTAQTISGEEFELTERLKLSNRFKITKKLQFISILSLISWILLLIAFASPYWLSSYKYTYSEFVRLGLWDYCFKNYRHPTYQYDQKFNGCYWIYSNIYHNIRDWLQPNWFIFVQTMIVISFIFSSIVLIIFSILFMYYLTKYHVSLLYTICGFLIVTVITIFFGIVVFALKAFDRGWLIYPNFNHLDWAYYVAIGSMITHLLSFGLLILETKEIRIRKKKINNLIYNMQPGTILSGLQQEEKDTNESKHQDQLDAIEKPNSKQNKRNKQLHFTQV